MRMMSVNKNFSLRGKVAICTGGAGRLGPKVVEALAEAGAHVVLVDLDKRNGYKATKKLSKRFGKSVIFYHADVTNKSSVQDLVSFTARKFKKIDILVNAAMGMHKDYYGPVDSYSWDAWNHVMAVDVGGSFLCSRAVAKEMKKQQNGVIINFASIYGVVGADQRIYGESKINSPAVYAASKGAIISLTRYLAVYWAPYGIRVNAISPGGVFNNQNKDFVKNYRQRTPMARMLDSGELKGAIVFLASSAASYVTGHNLLVDGGWTVW